MQLRAGCRLLRRTPVVHPEARHPGQVDGHMLSSTVKTVRTWSTKRPAAASRSTVDLKEKIPQRLWLARRVTGRTGSGVIIMSGVDRRMLRACIGWPLIPC